MPIGNDVVDLGANRAIGKASDERFVRRVFSEAERESIDRARLPDLMLWRLWSGKEAAYKAARKIEADILFAHRLFEVTLDPEPIDGRGTQTGSVLVPGAEGLIGLRLRWEVTSAYVHCVATTPGVAEPAVRGRVVTLDELGAEPSAGYELTPREAESVRWPASRAVRRLARSLAEESGVGGIEIVRVPLPQGYEHPRVYAMGASEPLPGWDVTLSHDGAFVAAVISHP